MIVSLIISLLTWKTAIALLLGLVVFKVITWLQSPLRKIPGPKGHFLLGNLRDLASPNDPLQCFVKWKEQYGDVFKIWSPMADAVDQSVFSYRYLPFSRGPRMCIGYRFAELELKTVLAKLLRSLTFKLGKNQSADFKAEWVLTLRPNPAPVVAISKVED
eukprot:gene5204-5858_t